MSLRLASPLSPSNIILDFREHLSNYIFFEMHLVIENGAHGFFKINFGALSIDAIVFNMIDFTESILCVTFWRPY